MLTIRLSRVGKKNKPMYRLVISEKAHDPYGRALEILGSYNPYTKDLKAKEDRIKYWISKGSQTSPSVNNLWIEKGVIEGKKVKASKVGKKKKEGEKAEEKVPDSPAGEGGEKKPEEKVEQPEEKKEPKETEAEKADEEKKDK